MPLEGSDTKIQDDLCEGGFPDPSDDESPSGMNKISFMLMGKTGNSDDFISKIPRWMKTPDHSGRNIVRTSEFLNRYTKIKKGREELCRTLISVVLEDESDKSESTEDAKFDDKIQYVLDMLSLGSMENLWMERILNRVPGQLKVSTRSIQVLTEEIKDDYRLSSKKAIDT
ncbi:dynein axonemal heavy chain 7-like [Clarias gariepinus]